MDSLLFSQARYQIVQICDCIYRKKWEDLYNVWEKLDLQLEKIIPQNEKIYDVLAESRRCRAAGNFMRFHDLLSYEVDLFLARKLCGRTEDERKLLSRRAKVENMQALEMYHANILALLHTSNKSQRIKCSYAGTENVTISVKEGDCSFRLYSSINPWLECATILNMQDIEGEYLDEIYVLGFGGGHAVEELERRYPKAQIKVYLPNTDIFQAVVCNMPRSTVLLNQRLELLYDPMCICFFDMLEKNIGKKRKVTAHIDRQELRACFRSSIEAERMIIKYKNKLEQDDLQNYVCGFNSLEMDNVGKSIYEYINEL